MSAGAVFYENLCSLHSDEKEGGWEIVSNWFLKCM